MITNNVVIVTHLFLLVKLIYHILLLTYDFFGLSE